MLPNITPLDTTFPLLGDARLAVIARGRGLPIARKDSVLTLEVSNEAREPVEVRGVYAGFRYTNVLVEVAFGRKTPRLRLNELEGGMRPPRVLSVGESVTWTANLSQLAEELEEQQLTLGPHSRFMDLKRVGLERWTSRGRLAVKVRNAIARLSYRRVAVVVEDDRGYLYKTKVRWQPPGESPPNARTLSGSRA